jgi:hypothetical protein
MENADFLVEQEYATACKFNFTVSSAFCTPLPLTCFMIQDGLFLESGNLLLAQYITKCLDTGDSFDSSILRGLKESDDDEDEEPTTSSPQLDVTKTDPTPIVRRQSREEEEAIESLKHTEEAPNTIEEQTAKINITDDDEGEDVNEAVNPTIGANSMVDVLIAFLRFLPEPVIPVTLHKRLLDGTLSTNVDQVEVAYIQQFMIFFSIANFSHLFS